MDGLRSIKEIDFKKARFVATLSADCLTTEYVSVAHDYARPD